MDSLNYHVTPVISNKKEVYLVLKVIYALKLSLALSLNLIGF